MMSLFTMPDKNLNSPSSLSQDAQNAIAEAQARREAATAAVALAAEKGGPRGEEPTRFGDWERKGIAYDF